MKHDVSLAGEAFGLRPVSIDDAEFILELRGNAERTRYLHRISESLEVQREFLEKSLCQSDEYYFVIYRLGSGSPEGTLTLYHIDEIQGCGEFGRWILRPGSMAALESAWLLFELAFSKLGLEQVYTRTVADNEKVVSFHSSFGLETASEISRCFHINGRDYDAIEQRMTRERWYSLRDTLLYKVQRVAQMVNR